MKSLLYVELDILRCSLTYGVSPCTASIPTTGTKKCFNTRATCQDLANFDNLTQTLRFGKPSNHYPESIECIPSLSGVSMSGVRISLGEDLGQRATVTVTFRDHPFNDDGQDSYIADRAYDPQTQGSFWGKFRSRQPFIQGQSLRVIRGQVGQVLQQMETRHFVVESFNGPTPKGEFTIVAKDVLKLADGDRAQCPELSNGFLLAGINTTDTAANLSPAGVGNAEYPASGYVAIGGTEICSFTRSGNALTLTRGQLGTVGVTHAAEDRVQLVKSYVGMDPADIIYDLLINYAGIDPSFLPLADWQLETSTYLQRLYTARLAEPTSVNKLVSEIVEQAALAIWWDDIARQVKLQVLRGVAANAGSLSVSLYEKGSFTVKEQPNKRISRVWTYYGLRNPLRPVEDPDNYLSAAVTIDSVGEENYRSPSIKKIFSRWIPSGGRSVALRVNDIQLGRYADPPRLFTVSAFRGTLFLQLANGYVMTSPQLQDDTGASELVPVQVTSLNSSERGEEIEAQEILFKNFDPADLSDRVIIIETPTNDINFRALHDTLFPAPVPGDVGTVTVTLIIQENVVVGSSSGVDYSIIVGTWPVGLAVNIINYGIIYGRGGDGGNGGGYVVATAGQPGGSALYTRKAIGIENHGVIAGGGGGAGGGGAGNLPFSGSRGPGGGGGGGRGANPGAGGPPGEGGVTLAGSPGAPGTQLIPGSGGVNGTSYGSEGGEGGTGGDLGTAGASGSNGLNTSDGNGQAGASGGAAGLCTDGDSYITWTLAGTRIGSRIN